LRPASVKAKGRTLQQTVRDKVLETFPRLEKDDVKSTSMGATGEDIQLSPAARRSFPFSVECKSRATIGVYKWYDQAVTNAGSGVEPLLVIKANRRKPLVVIDLDAFMELVK
jgi:hypothetical protein